MNCVHLDSFRIKLYVQSIVKNGAAMNDSTSEASGDIPRYFQIAVCQCGRKVRQITR